MTWARVKDWLLGALVGVVALLVLFRGVLRDAFTSPKAPRRPRAASVERVKVAEEALSEAVKHEVQVLEETDAAREVLEERREVERGKSAVELANEIIRGG
jgi:hypothetical protein